MRKPTAVVAVAVLFMLTWFFWPNAAAQVRVEIPNAAKAEGQKWEYRMPGLLADQLTEREFAEYGKQGWEFCQAVPSQGSPHTLVIFKRPLK